MRFLTTIAAAAITLHGGFALADEQTDQLTAPKGKVVIDGFVEVNLSKSLAGKPISLSPDGWYGVTDDVTVGLVHSSVGATGFLGGAGDSLCLTGTKNGCAKFYNDVGIDVRYRLKTPLAFDGGLYVRNFDPFQLALKLGIAGRWRFAGKGIIEVQPSLAIGLTKRDGNPPPMGTMGSGGPLNQEVLSLPITVGYEVVDKLELALQTGVQTPFKHAGDGYRIPLSIAGRYQITPHVGLGLAFTLPALAGGGPLTGVDARTLLLGGSYAL